MIFIACKNYVSSEAFDLFEETTVVQIGMIDRTLTILFGEKLLSLEIIDSSCCMWG